MATYKTKDEVVITPATWQQRSGTLKKTPSGLYNLVGWYGSTHKSAMWRKAHQFLDVFQGMDGVGFDPQIDDWDVSYAAIAAEVLATASVVIIRLENNELLNGSLGSIAEIGMALTSAALRGQIVIVSIEEGLLTSLNESGAIAQYMMLELSLEQLDEISDLTQFLQIHRGDDLQELAIMACQATKEQMETPQAGLDFDSFITKKARRSQNYPLRVLLGGSGGPYSKAYEERFQEKKQALISAYRADGQMVKVLSEGAIAEAWKIPYGSIDNLEVALATRTLLAIEIEFKQEADVLLIPIMAEAASKAAATEIGLLLLHSLITGQNIKIYLEPFDPVDYIRHQLADVDIAGIQHEKQMRQALLQAGVSANILSIAVQTEIYETFNIFRAMMQGDQTGTKQIKNSLLGKTAAFQKADNIRRVRALVQAHLERLHNDSRFTGFFTYLTQIEV